MLYDPFWIINGLTESAVNSNLTVRKTMEEAMSGNAAKAWNSTDRRQFIGGSDARIIMGDDDAALIRLWREKRGEIGPEDLSGNLIVQLGKVTEDLNRSWYERNTGRTVGDVQRLVKHSAIPWMAATLDGIVEGTAAVFEAKFMELPSCRQAAQGRGPVPPVPFGGRMVHARMHARIRV